MTSAKSKFRHFTLTELSVAMIILMLIIYALFRTIGGAQRAWNGSRATSTMHENATLALDVIAQDLRAMQVSNVDGLTINYLPDPEDVGGSVPNGMKFAFVTTSRLGVDESDLSPLAEVAYSYSASDSTLYRWRTTYSASSDWDFYNAPATTWAAAGSWEDSVVVATGVESVTFTARSDSNDASTVASTSDTRILPTAVSVALTLVDERVADASTVQSARTRLSFSKTIHLNRSE